MLNGEGNENSKKKTNKQTTKQTKQNKTKQNKNTTWNFLRYMFYGGIKCRMCFCLFFFSLLLIFTLVATSVSQFVTNTIEFSCLFLSFAQSIHVRVDIKI